MYLYALSRALPWIETANSQKLTKKDPRKTTKILLKEKGALTGTKRP